MESRHVGKVGRLPAGRWLAFALAAAAVAAPVVPIAVASVSTTSAAKVTAVSVKARDNGFTLSAPVAKTGTVRFVVKNLGKRNHDFRIGGKKTPVLKPGKGSVLVVKLKKPGKYAYVSTLSGDARKGLRGTFTSVSALTAVGVKARENGFTLSVDSAPVGAVRFVVKNLGARPHTFRIGGSKTPVLKPGKAVILYAVFGRAGKYAYASTIPGDARKGLKGVFTLAAPTASAGGNVKLGKAIFIANGCGACHVLKAAGASGTIGTNLDVAKPARATIVKVVTNGRTGKLGTMPAFKGSLTAAQIDDLAAFVDASTH